jgi:peptide chain release factor 1
VGTKRWNGWNWQESDPVEGSSIFKAVVGGSGSSILGPYGFLRFESGVHRVQRVPFNSDRMQTSAAAVVVLPKIEIPEIRLKDSEIKISISKKSSGAGGQSVNAAYQQVTLKHLPTGFTVTCADSHAQQENKEMAYTRLRQRVQEFEEEKVLASLAKTRKSQATTADRSEKIRTYNFQRGEVNDHRVSGCVVKEDVGEFMGDGESLVDIIWGKLVENAENEAISNLFK